MALNVAPHHRSDRGTAAGHASLRAYCFIALAPSFARSLIVTPFLHVEKLNTERTSDDRTRREKWSASRRPYVLTTRASELPPARLVAREQVIEYGKRRH